MVAFTSLLAGALLCLAPLTTNALPSPADAEDLQVRAVANDNHVHLEDRALEGRALTTTQYAYLNAHNAARATHGAKALSWTGTGANLAQTWANKCVWQHGGASGFGQNLFISATSGSTIKADPRQALNSWMAEESLYDFSKPGFSSATGHFTQVVWKSTTRVGCASAICKNIKDGSGKLLFSTQFPTSAFTVCNYHLPGNYQGQFAQNVQKGT